MQIKAVFTVYESVYLDRFLSIVLGNDLDLLLAGEGEGDFEELLQKRTNIKCKKQHTFKDRILLFSILK